MIVNEPERRGRIFFFIWTGILFVGIAVMLYPKVGKLWNAGRQSRVVDGYERSVEKLDVRKEEEMIAQTRAYNVMLLEQNNPVPNDKNADSYGALLNMTSDGVMGYLEIPAIRVKLPIYHGTGDLAICNGAGHVEGSSFPIGGKGTHAVLSSHRGLPGAKLFADLDKLKVILADISRTAVIGNTIPIVILSCYGDCFPAAEFFQRIGGCSCLFSQVNTGAGNAAICLCYGEIICEYITGCTVIGNLEPVINLIQNGIFRTLVNFT